MTITTSVLAHSVAPALASAAPSEDGGISLWIIILVFAVLGIGVGVAVVLATSTKRKAPDSRESATAEAEAGMLAHDTSGWSDGAADAGETDTSEHGDEQDGDGAPRRP